MKFFAYIALLLCLGVSLVCAQSDPLQKGKTGIESIDTLTVNEWDIPTTRNSLPLTMLFSIFPGGGPYYTAHYIRGGFITAFAAFLFYDVYYNKAYQNRHPETLYIDVGQVYGENNDVYAQRKKQARHQKFCIEFANIFKVFHSNYPTYTLKICLSALFL